MKILSQLAIKRWPIAILLYLQLFSARGQQPDYTAEAKFDRAKISALTGTINPVPMFLKDGEIFWYAFKDDAIKGHYWVDAHTGKQRLMFDQAKAAKGLSRLLHEPVDSAKLRAEVPIALKATDHEVNFKYRDKSFLYNFFSGKVRLAPSALPKHYKSLEIGQYSADSCWILFSVQHNLYLKNLRNGKTDALSSDAVPYYSFDINSGDNTKSRQARPCDAVWLGATPYFYVIRKDTRRVKSMSVLNSLSNPRPTAETYKYELPGDKEVAQYELFIGDTLRKAINKVNLGHWKDQEVEVVGQNIAEKEIYVLLKKRTRDEMALCAVNLVTFNVRQVIDEVSKPYFDPDMFNVKIINGGKKILWWSDRTGWGHYYLYNSNGVLLRELGPGNYTAGRIAYMDDRTQALYFKGYGKEPSRNPYYAHLYKADLRTGKLTLLTPENATHAIYFSPGGRYFVDTYSQINQTPVTQVRRADGKLIAVLQKPSFKKLFDYGWRAPEPFTVKAADGVTDLYGIMWKPFNFDPKKKYPVISQVYPGPQTETVWTDFTVFDKYNNAPLAQLGVIVVCMGHRGGSPLRNKPYASFDHGNLRDAPLADDKAGLEQLAKQFSFIDLSRVGIFGHSGGGMMALAAICTYPDFYKVAVSSSGNHDQVIYNRFWGETYQGIEEVKNPKQPDSVSFKFINQANQALVKNLKGHLLLVTGDVDQNVHPANTLRVVDALVKQNKDFDMLVLPGQSHHYDELYEPYFEKRRNGYFAKYLLGDSLTH
ncbi:prolyl oligopeptidase family serine peptidase [Mucilaginibacter sp. RS28]|uniref:Prolyl oligopeptidase family serine peptidase n=1 Tax=Mucilaginibacter straminoryzae TaxID=2932774 RepID=A0A9X1X2P1_9SPHI|nr:DPP IV N-terminal domain-containing protein [Mucilaginibacter straminoryzae]MCJ8209756.1 prolyl oligopeptidase family serine peptidase [Mucilaginibacter straminoryzae]